MNVFIRKAKKTKNELVRKNGNYGMDDDSFQVSSLFIANAKGI